MKAALCIDGFGDNDSMFEPLMKTDLARHLKLLPIDLPGFGEPSLSVTFLDTLADVINERAIQQSAAVVMAHSVASIIASLAAVKDDSPLEKKLSHLREISPRRTLISPAWRLNILTQTNLLRGLS